MNTPKRESLASIIKQGRQVEYFAHRDEYEPFASWCRENDHRNTVFSKYDSASHRDHSGLRGTGPVVNRSLAFKESEAKSKLRLIKRLESGLAIVSSAENVTLVEEAHPSSTAITDSGRNPKFKKQNNCSQQYHRLISSSRDRKKGVRRGNVPASSVRKDGAGKECRHRKQFKRMKRKRNCTVHIKRNSHREYLRLPRPARLRARKQPKLNVERIRKGMRKTFFKERVNITSYNMRTGSIDLVVPLGG